MVCSGLDTLTSTSITGILNFPTTCFYHFWTFILVAIWIILALTLFYNDKSRYQKADMLSSLGVSAMATIFIALMGTLLDIVQVDVFKYIFVGGMVFVVLWFIRK